MSRLAYRYTSLTTPKIQVVLDREQEIARQHLRAGKKDRAVVALRQRKYQETLLAKTDGQLEQLEQLVSTIEFSLVQASVLHGLKQGNEVLKELHKEMSTESVERLLEETAEARAYQKVRLQRSPRVRTDERNTGNRRDALEYAIAG